MAVTVPEWLSKRGASLRQGSDGSSWFVVLDQEPHYRLSPVPAGGQFSCQIVQTINGKRLDKGGLFPTPEEAVRGGLEQLGQVLGWC